jgi:hypothetical protein
MFETNIFKLNTAVADGLMAINALKELVVRSQKYEEAAKLRDIEKQLENIEKQISCDKLSISVIHKGLTPNGRLFFNQIFNYNIHNNWLDVPANFDALLRDRKVKLNTLIEFNDSKTKNLLDLNSKLAFEESRIDDFLKFVLFSVSVKGIKDCVDALNPGTINLKCYTNGNHYEGIAGVFDYNLPFYQFRFPLDDFLTNISVCRKDDVPQQEFLNSLPIKFREEKICLLFSLLATDGLLAWQDFLHIDKVEINMDMQYAFTTSKPVV